MLCTSEIYLLYPFHVVILFLVFTKLVLSPYNTSLQETPWQQAFDNFQGQIKNKVDISEYTLLKNFVNSKLKVAEAAGTKLKLLRYIKVTF
jgi:hypothetical protein